MFYNCENLYDCNNDSLTNDDDFTPSGSQYWTPDKLKRKLLNLSRVIIAVGEWSPPEIIGFCEVENRYVLSKLIYATLLSRVGYKIIHKDSPDRRGIDVAMIYNPERFIPTDTCWLTININQNTEFKTRDILFVQGNFITGDSVYIFINHWPSRRGGETQSEYLRMAVAKILRSKVDSIFSVNKYAKIVIMGDFNDEPVNQSIAGTLAAKTDLIHISDTGLYNLSYHFFGKAGTHKMGHEWSVLDQIIVSSGLLTDTLGCYTTSHAVNIFKAPFLFQPETDGIGDKPFRTYQGPKYLGGFSDHLPVYIDLFIAQAKNH